MRPLLEVAADAMTLNPAAGSVDVRVHGECHADLPLRLQVDGHEVVVDVEPTLGGDGTAPDAVAHALAALGAGQLITFLWCAARLDVALDAISVVVRGRSDLRGSLGTDADVGPHLQHVEVALTAVGPEATERYVEVDRLVERHSTVLALFACGTRVTSRLVVDPSS